MKFSHLISPSALAGSISLRSDSSTSFALLAIASQLYSSAGEITCKKEGFQISGYVESKSIYETRIFFF